MSAHTYQLASPVLPILPDRFVGVVTADGQEARVAAIVCQSEGGVALLNLAGAETTAMAIAMNLVRVESNEQKAAKQKVVFTPAPDLDWARPTTLLRVTGVSYKILKAPIVNTKGRNLLLLAQTGNIGAIVRHYTDVQVFTVPADEFERYTQIVVVGKKRAIALEHPDPLQKDRLRAYRYKHDPEHPQRSPWAGGASPPELPTTPLLTLYRVPAAKDRPSITVRRAGESLVLRGMLASGIQHKPEWIAATTWQPDVALEQPIMPISGLAHQSALIMTDMFAGEAFQGPDGQWYTFLAHVGMEWTTVDPEDDEKAKGVTHIDQQQDHMTLSVLNLDTGDITHYQKDAVFEFLAPWLPILAERVLARYQPLYDLNPPDWLLDVACQIGLDKALPGANHPGLAVPQLHRVFAMWYALCAKGYVAMQGEPGTGKSRMHTLLMAIFAYAWANHSRLFTRTNRPKWIDKLRRAWRANPRTIGDAPRALPLLVVTPKRVMPVWEAEITAAWDAIAWQDELRTRWPAAEVMVIETHHDITRWMQRCARSSAPAVIAIVSQSSTRAFGRVWRPAVIEKPLEVKVPDLSPAAAERGEPIIESGRVVGYRDPASGNLITTTSCTPRFFCPDCGALQLGIPRSVSKPEAGQDEAVDDRLEPIESLTYFSYKPRSCCACGTPLWSDSRVPAAQRKYPQLPFAAWSQAAPQLVSTILPTAKGKPARPMCGSPSQPPAACPQRSGTTTGVLSGG